jgi:hypothetical protein
MQSTGRTRSTVTPAVDGHADGHGHGHGDGHAERTRSTADVDDDEYSDGASLAPGAGFPLDDDDPPPSTPTDKKPPSGKHR